TGSVSAEKLSILPNSSLTVGGNIDVKNLFVGVDEQVERMMPQSVTDDEGIVSNCGPMTKCVIMPTPISPVQTPRLDIGNNTATAEYASFTADSTLALTVNSEKDYGKVVAGAFDIEEGAKLEVTVLPYFSEPGKEFTLQLLAVDEDLLTVQSDDNDEDAEGFNNFSEDYIGADGEDVIANNMFEIKRIDDEGNYSFKQIKKAEDIIDPTPIPSPAPMPQYSGMAKAWLSDGPMTTPGSIGMQQLLANTAQHKSAREFKDTLIALAPNDAPVAQALATKTMGHVFSGVGAHLSKPKSGLSSGDALNGVSAWGSTYYGQTKLDDRAGDAYGFDADSKGVTVGADKQITPSTKLGLGLQYDKSDIDAFRADVDVETIAAFGYGEFA
ncbi:MAG: autotransporter outer membrane beta-barrel domain-containing protein, partial [Alphaproteobacteria bacterium]|nr:autotransporter outer membrane beta-barrel domain-containing protein [Alphaproteobacteria bacterium]